MRPAYNKIRARLCYFSGPDLRTVHGAMLFGSWSPKGHSRLGRASRESSHVRCAAESGSKFRTLAALPPGVAGWRPRWRLRAAVLEAGLDEILALGHGSVTTPSAQLP